MQRQGFVGDSAAVGVRAAGGVLLAVHLAFVAWLMLRPLDVPWVTPPNLHPLAGIRADLALGRSEAARRIGEGLALLAPLGVLLPVAHGRLTGSPFASLVRTTAAGALVSVGIALLQTGVPGRIVDVDSLLLNTAGVALAHLAVVPVGRAWLRRRSVRDGGVAGGRTTAGGTSGRATVFQEEPAQGRTPTIPRVGIAP